MNSKNRPDFATFAIIRYSCLKSTFCLEIFVWKSDEIATLLAGAPTQARHKLSNSDKIKTLELGQEQKLSKRTETQK